MDLNQIESIQNQGYDISIVIPIHNEASTIDALYHDIKQVMESQSLNWELIMVNDGSTDLSLSIMKALSALNEGLRIIDFTRNFGQSAALSAGIAYSHGRIIITMDGDSQYDPKDIVRFVERIDQGVELVNGHRRHRQDSYWWRRLPSRWGNCWIRGVTGIRHQDSGCMFRAFTRPVANQLRLYGEMHRYWSILADQLGIRQNEIPITHFSRVSGRSNYGLARCLRVIPDVIALQFFFKYKFRLFHFCFWIGAMIIMVILGIAAWIGFQDFPSPKSLVSSYRGIAIVIGGLLSGLLWILIAFMLEFLYHSFYFNPDHQPYRIRQLIGFNNTLSHGESE